MTIWNQQTAYAWGCKASVAVGAIATAASIPLVVCATSHADAASELLGGGADLVSSATIPDLSGLVNFDALVSADPTTVPDAIAAALVPITTAGNEVDAALLAPGLSDAFETILNGQSQVLDSQTEVVTMIGDMQAGFTGLDVTDLVKLDDLLTIANTNVLDATTDFIATAGDPVTAQFSAALDLVSADFSAIFTDLQVAGVGATANLLDMFGIDPGFLFDGLSAGI